MSLNWDQEAAQTLRDAGLKATPQRLAILRALDGDETHPTAQELYERLREEFPTLSVATVYNTLSALTRLSRCAPLELGGPVRFDPNTSAHDHAVCERCGRIRDVLQPMAASETGAALSGFQVRRVERIYRGFCAQCAEAAQAVAK
ncbi:MAG TPA: Fur family transcriptional regulator [Polyangiales bacterium]|nr:Fur family transcriptional regulator [Polyangiales bacterium]